MSRIRTLMHQIGDEASPPPDDLADRALAEANGAQRGRREQRSGRRSSVPAVVAAAASVAAVLMVATLVIPQVTREQQSTTFTSGKDVVRFPENAEELPASGVGPAALAYRVDRDSGECGKRLLVCSKWRIVTVDGEHFEVSAEATEIAETANLTLSPSGDRIVYQRANGQVVLRELGSGRVTELFHREPEGKWSKYSDGSYAWSGDGRWLISMGASVSCDPPDSDPCDGEQVEEPSILVDTESGETVDIGDGSGYAIGLPNGTGPFPFEFDVSETGKGQRIAMVDRSSGEVVRHLPEDVAPSASDDGVLASVSPDGTRLAAITFPKGDKDRNGAWPLITVTNLETGETMLSQEVRRDWKVWDSPTFLGWQDESHVLIGTRDVRGHDLSGRVSRDVHALDIPDGSMERILHLPDRTSEIVLASGLF